METQKIFLYTIIVILLATTIFFGISSFKQMQILKDIGYGKVNQPVLAFQQAFIKDILFSKKNIDFNDRVELETMVRNLNDSEILTLWEAFTTSTTKEAINLQAELLFNLLVQKVYY